MEMNLKKGDTVTLSPKYGFNPSINVCFFCGEDKGELILPGRLEGDAEAPHRAVYNYEPCEKCKKQMKNTNTEDRSTGFLVFMGSSFIGFGLMAFGLRINILGIIGILFSLFTFSLAYISHKIDVEFEQKYNEESNTISLVQKITTTKSTKHNVNTATSSNERAEQCVIIPYPALQNSLDQIEKKLKSGYKFRSISVEKYKNTYFTEIKDNCSIVGLPPKTINGYAEILNLLLDDMYNAELENNITEAHVTLVMLQTLVESDGLKKDLIRDFYENKKEFKE